MLLRVYRVSGIVVVNDWKCSKCTWVMGRIHFQLIFKLYIHVGMSADEAAVSRVAYCSTLDRYTLRARGNDESDKYYKTVDLYTRK